MTKRRFKLIGIAGHSGLSIGSSIGMGRNGFCVGFSVSARRAMRRAWPVWVSALLVGCSPPLDWRDYTPEGSGIRVTMPCRADRYTRVVEIAGRSTAMTLLTCENAGVHYAVAYVDVIDPAQMTATLVAWRRITAGNVQGRVVDASPITITGMTANAEAGRVRLAGRLPNGSAVLAQVGHFAHGLRVYQATVTGAVLPPAAVDPFFAGLRIAASATAG